MVSEVPGHVHGNAGLHSGVDVDVGHALEPGQGVCEVEGEILTSNEDVFTCHVNFGSRGRYVRIIFVCLEILSHATATVL